MGLNTGQQAAFVEAIKFINDKDQKYFFVSGDAGTGKTYFISEVADGILKHKQSHVELYDVALTATTNKAAAVIRQAMPHRAPDIKTIYSFMNLRVTENFKTGTQKCIPIPSKWIVHSNTLIIIDECSMVNKELLEYIEKGTDSTCKVLFVGDKNQLSPVKETVSQIFTRGYGCAYLTEPVRNANQPALMALCAQAKETVLTGIFTPIIEVPGVIDFINENQLTGILEREYATEDPTRRVLSYTNKKVVAYNTFIRAIRGYTDPFVLGEILSNNSAVELAGKIRLYTDQVLEVVNLINVFQDTTVVKGEEVPVVNMEVKDVMTGAVYAVKAFCDPQHRAAALKFYADRKEWAKHFRIKGLYPDLRSIAASTTHKAQGSTYDSVVVDLADIGKSTDRAQTARMQYVALSRPKSRIYIRGQLPPRYF